MTFEQLFAGRMLLMRVQRHICQANRYDLIKPSHGMFMPVFEDEAAASAFTITERLLIELELEFTEKKKLCDRGKRRKLDRRANRQVVL